MQEMANPLFKTNHILLSQILLNLKLLHGLNLLPSSSSAFYFPYHILLEGVKLENTHSNVGVGILQVKERSIATTNEHLVESKRGHSVKKVNTRENKIELGKLDEENTTPIKRRGLKCTTSLQCEVKMNKVAAKTANKQGKVFKTYFIFFRKI
jgi:hypothetical protein